MTTRTFIDTSYSIRIDEFGMRNNNETIQFFGNRMTFELYEVLK